MRLLALFMLLGFCSVHAASHGQEAVVDLRMSGATLSEVFQQIERQTDYMFVYKIEDVRAAGRVDVDASGVMVKDVLARCLQNTGLVYVFRDNVIVIQREDDEKPEAQKAFTAKGWVYDEKKQPMPGVTVRVVGTTVGTATNEKGWFSIDLPINKGKLEFSFVGYKKQQVDFTEKTDTLRVTMEEDAVDIDEVVVTGIFNKNRGSFTGAVTSVSREELKAHYSRNLIQTLANIDPSLRIIENNEMGSDPNTLPEIQLRGSTTMLSVQDLNNQTRRPELNQPLFILDGFEVDLERVMDLNEDEIEDITILKDAGATAIYGARGANGVVVIRSVRAKSGKVNVYYQGEVKLEIPNLSTYDELMTAKEKLDLEEFYGVWDNPEYAEIHQELREAVDNGFNYDWTAVPTRTGVGQRHVFSIGGGAEAWRFRLNLAYNATAGAVKKSDRNNFNGSMEIDYTKHSLSIRQILSVGTNNSQNSPYGNFSQYVQMNRYWNPYNEDGTPVDYFFNPDNPIYQIPNPLYDVSVGVWNKTRYTTLRSSTMLNYSFIPELQFQVSLGLSRTLKNADSFYPPEHQRFDYQTEIDQKGSYTRGETETNRWDVRATLNYAKTFKEKHMLTLGASMNMEEEVSDYVNWSATGYLTSDIDHPGMSLGYPSTGNTMGSKTTVRRISFVGTANYFYDYRYFVDFSYTLNGASSFGSNSRFSSFYSIGGGWNIHEEKFIKENVGFIDRLKLRYTYGIVGNMAFSPEISMEVFRRNPNETYIGGVGVEMNQFGNPNLEQQNTYKHNAGIEIDLWDGRLSLNVNYYRETTGNTLTSMYLPISHGFDNIQGNVGKIRNTGYDGSLSIELLRNDEKELRWWITASLHNNKQVVVKLSEGFKKLMQGSFTSLNQWADYMRYQEGHSLSGIYGLRTLGVDPLSGQRIYVSKDGEPTLAQRGEDLVYLGDSQPKVNGNIGTQFYWKGISLNVDFNVKWGGVAVNSTELMKGENADLRFNVYRWIKDRTWRESGDHAIYSDKRDDHDAMICDMFVHKDNVFQCTNIKIGYSLPPKWLSQLRLQSLTFTANLSDIFYLSTIERERGTAYPYSIAPTFSLSCSF